MKKVERESNYELLRVFSMLMIVLWHIIIHGKVFDNTTGIINFVFSFLMFFIVIHVNLFMLTTGYYQSKGKLKKEKVLSLILQVGFYNLLINSILKFTGLIEYSNIDFIKSIFFFNFQSYWFFSCYFVVYLISPYLNKLIENIDRKMFKKLLITLFLVFSILPFFTNNLLFVESGYTLNQFVFMYLIGAYIRKYEVNVHLMEKYNLYQKRFFLMLIFLLAFIMNFSLNYICQFAMNLDSNIINYISSSLKSLLLAYNNPLVIIQAVSVFLLFGTFSIKSKLINLLGGLTFGVYLIHESFYTRLNLYKWMGIDSGKLIVNKSFIVKIFIYVLIIYFVCSLIELIRKILFNLVSRLKISRNINKKMINLVENIAEIK